MLDALSRGWIESKNLVEWLSVDRRILLDVLSVELNIDLSPMLRALIEDRESLSPLQLSKRIAIELASIIPPSDERFKSLEQHKRCRPGVGSADGRSLGLDVFCP